MPNSAKQPQGPRMPLYSTPLGSPTGPWKRVFWHAPTFGYALVSRCVRAGYGTRDGYSGWVMGGLYRVPSHEDVPLLSEAQTAKRAPEAPTGGWSGWSGCSAPGRPAPTLRARSCPCWALPGASSSKPRLLANKARFNNISWKLSQNGEVSPHFAEKACHSPYFQNRPQKSPLGILRFLISPAFSHKELMGHFYPYP